MSTGRVYGPIEGIDFYHSFKDRAELSRAGVHAPIQAGIHGTSDENGGAFSICLSGGYEDNRDRGDKITYVGSGGQDDYGQQIADQSFDDPRNQSLVVSSKTKRPVRVIRGKDDSNPWSPRSGYRYDGLYVVDSAEMKPGKKGFNMCFFELRRLDEGQNPVPYRSLISKTMANMRKRARK